MKSQSISLTLKPSLQKLTFILSMIILSINSQAVRDCLAGESNCNPDAAAYTCLEGSAKGGCNSDPSFWPAHGCPNQCKKTNSPGPGPGPSPSPPPPPSGRRTFLVKNHSEQDLYIAVLIDPQVSSPLDEGDSGFLLTPGQNRVVNVGPKFSGRIWARTGCVRVQKKGGGKPSIGTPMSMLEKCQSEKDSDCLLACDTGNCKAGNGLAGEFQCTVSGETPCSVVEFTLGGYGGADFYDLSNVDGYSVGMTVEALGGEPVPGVPPEFNCGNPSCKIQEDASLWCPEELKFHTPSGVYCTSICKALEYNHIQQVDDTKIFTVQTGSNKFTGTAKQYLQFLSTTDDFMDSLARGGKMRDRLCCQCGQGGGACESLGSKCTYGCSPYVTNYGPEYDNRKCPAKYQGGKITESPDWPASTLGNNFADIYKERCNQAYSWQFNDSASTYLCKNADYDITFS